MGSGSDRGRKLDLDERCVSVNLVQSRVGMATNTFNFGYIEYPQYRYLTTHLTELAILH
jgi:hypothetical protein